MHTTEPIPGAAMQLAEALAKSLRCTAFTEERTEFWCMKVALLAAAHEIPKTFLDGLCGPYSVPSDRRRTPKFDHGLEVINAARNDNDGGAPMRPSPSIRLALRAAAHSFDPLVGAGVLAFSPHRPEASFFRTKLNELYELVAACEAKAFELLAGLLAISLPGLRRDAVPDATLIARGLPEQEPSPDY